MGTNYHCYDAKEAVKKFVKIYKSEFGRPNKARKGDYILDAETFREICGWKKLSGRFWESLVRQFENYGLTAVWVKKDNICIVANLISLRNIKRKKVPQDILRKVLTSR